MINNNYRWGFTFLVSDSRVSEIDRNYLLREATVMYLCNESEQVLKTDTLEGRLTTQGKYDVLGSFSGQRFDAEVETNTGKAYLKFLVDERTGKNYSLNNSTKTTLPN